MIVDYTWNPNTKGLDGLALALMPRERAAAIAKYLRDRDTDALEPGWHGSKRRHGRPRRREWRTVCLPPRRYGTSGTLARRGSLPIVARDESCCGGAHRAHRGSREVRLHLTDAAIAHNIEAVISERFGTPEHGRGERSGLHYPDIRCGELSEVVSMRQTGHTAAGTERRDCTTTTKSRKARWPSRPNNWASNVNLPTDRVSPYTPSSVAWSSTIRTVSQGAQ
jgi:hypothetical protein